MKRKVAILLGILTLVITLGVAYFLFQKPSGPEAPSISQDQLQKGLQTMLAKKAEKKSVQTQLATYEKLLQQAPDNKELQQQVDSLRLRLKELEQ